MEKDSDEVFEMFCEFCHKKKGKNVPADRYCVSCITYFCTQCLDYHKEFQPSHVIQDKDNMPRDICLEKCSIHPSELIKFYCQSCKMFACSICKLNHKWCWRFYHLLKFVENFENSKEFRKYENSLEAAEKDIMDLETVIRNSKTKVSSYNSDAKTVINKQREVMNALFDDLEKEIDNYKVIDEPGLTNNLEELDVLKMKLHLIKSNTEDQKTSGERIKLFMQMKNTVEEVREIKENIKQLENSTDRKEINKYRYIPTKITRSDFGRLAVEKERIRHTEGQWFATFY